MLYRCDECKAIRHYPTGAVGLCACGASPAAWMPVRNAPASAPGTADAGAAGTAATAGPAAARRSLRYRLADGLGGSISGNATASELLADLRAKYGTRLASVRDASGLELHTIGAGSGARSPAKTLAG